MTTATITVPRPRSVSRADGRAVTPRRILNAEWIKFRSLRSSWYTLVAAVVVIVAFGGILGYSTSTSNWATLSARSRAATSPLAGYNLAQLLIGVLGVSFVTGEYATGMIRSTFAAVPRRIPVLAAKTTVFGAIALIAATIASFAAFFTAQAFLSQYGHGSSLTDPGVLLPSEAGGTFLTTHPDAHSLAPWTGLGVLVLWVAVALAAAVILVRRRDA